MPMIKISQARRQLLCFTAESFHRYVLSCVEALSLCARYLLFSNFTLRCSVARWADSSLIKTNSSSLELSSSLDWKAPRYLRVSCLMKRSSCFFSKWVSVRFFILLEMVFWLSKRYASTSTCLSSRVLRKSRFLSILERALDTYLFQWLLILSCFALNSFWYNDSKVGEAVSLVATSAILS